MATTLIALLSALAVLNVSCGTVRPQASTTLEKLLDFEQRARSFPVLQEAQQETKINLQRTENPNVNLDTSTSLMFVSGGDFSKANIGEFNSVRLRGEDHFEKQVAVILDFWYPFIGQNLSGPIVAYEGYVQWQNSSGGATSSVIQGGVGHNHIKFELVHPLPGMTGYLYDYLILWSDS